MKYVDLSVLTCLFPACFEDHISSQYLINLQNNEQQLIQNGEEKLFLRELVPCSRGH